MTKHNTLLRLMLCLLRNLTELSTPCYRVHTFRKVGSVLNAFNLIFFVWCYFVFDFTSLFYGKVTHSYTRLNIHHKFKAT